MNADDRALTDRLAEALRLSPCPFEPSCTRQKQICPMYPDARPCDRGPALDAWTAAADRALEDGELVTCVVLTDIEWCTVHADIRHTDCDDRCQSPEADESDGLECRFTTLFIAAEVPT